jgi:hypothetical protein
MDMLCDSAAIANSGKRRSNAKIHVRPKAVLRVVRVDSDGARLSLLHSNINITADLAPEHCRDCKNRIARIGIDDSTKAAL